MYRSQAGKIAGGSIFSSLGARFVLHGEGSLRVVDGQRVLSYRLVRPGPMAGVHHMARALVLAISWSGGWWTRSRAVLDGERFKQEKR